jgi:hypothetical protein
LGERHTFYAASIGVFLAIASRCGGLQTAEPATP